MSLQLFPAPPNSPERERNLRKAREQVSYAADQARMKWLHVEQLALRLFGKKEGLNVSQCRELMKEIKRRVK